MATYIIFAYTISFRVKLIEERKKMNKIKIFMFGFLDLDKG